MVGRALIALAAVILAANLCGCKRPEGTPTGNGGASAGGGEPSRDTIVNPGPEDVQRSPLQELAFNYRQLEALFAREKLPLKVIEARSWLVARQARKLVDLHEHSTREKSAKVPLEELKKRELPEYEKLRAPGFVKDLDLMAINAKRLAVAAALWNARDVHEKFSNLKKAAARCMPAAPEPDSEPAEETVSPEPLPAPPAPGKVPPPAPEKAPPLVPEKAAPPVPEKAAPPLAPKGETEKAAPPPAPKGAPPPASILEK